MTLIVKKFGGTSVADIENIKNVASIIKSAIENNDKVVAVVSAMAGATNSLISKCSSVSELVTEEQMREYDASVSSGEIVTASLLALQLDALGIKSKSLQGWQVPIHTNNDVGNALVEQIPTEKIESLLKDGYTPVVTGFQGLTKENDVTTLGKGGSDTTAALLAAALGADRCDIYTDVDGVFTADPRVVETAQQIDEIEPETMLRLSELGAKVLHPRAAQAALKYNIDMQILSSFSKNPGTQIRRNTESQLEGAIVRAITGDRNIVSIRVMLQKEAAYGQFLEQLVAARLDYKSVEIDVNVAGEHMVVLQAKLTDQHRYTELLSKLQNQQLVSNYNYNSDIATVSLVGYGITNKMGDVVDISGGSICLKGEVLRILTKNGISFYGFACCNTDMTITINDRDLERALRELHILIKK